MNKNSKPIIVRAKTFKSWLNSNFTRQELKDMVRYGALTGYPGLTSHADLRKLFTRFEEEIEVCFAKTGQHIEYFVRGMEPFEMREFIELLTWNAAERLAQEILIER